MGAILSAIGTAIRWLTMLDAAVMIPLAILVISLLARMKFSTAFRASVTIGVGLIGLTAMTGVFASSVGPVIGAFVERTGVELEIADLGVFTLLTTVWGSSIAVFFIPVGLAVNLIMLVTNLTKTLDVDILNYWVWGISAVLVQTLTGSLGLGLLAFAINEIIILKVADWTAPAVQSHYEMPGVSIPHGNAALWPPVGIAVNWVIERIPGLRDLRADPDYISERFGVIGEPITIGIVLGVLLGLLGGQPLAGILKLGVTLAAVMLIFPRMVGILMEGLVPVSEAVRDFMRQRFKREVNIGLDAAVLIGFPACIAAGILLIPIIVLMMPILPGNHVLALADLAIATPFLISMCMPFMKGNVVRGVIAGFFVFALALWISGDLAPLITQAGAAMGAPVEEGVIWTSVGAGSHWIAWLLVKFFQLLGY
jgi:PTS system galactitol-specific IIC component